MQDMFIPILKWDATQSMPELPENIRMSSMAINPFSYVQSLWEDYLFEMILGIIRKRELSLVGAAVVFCSWFFHIPTTWPLTS